MVGDQSADARLDNVVTAAAVCKHAQLVLQIGRAIHADGHADMVLGKELDNRRRQQRRIGREAEVD